MKKSNRWIENNWKILLVAGTIKEHQRILMTNTQFVSHLQRVMEKSEDCLVSSATGDVKHALFESTTALFAASLVWVKIVCLYGVQKVHYRNPRSSSKKDCYSLQQSITGTINFTSNRVADPDTATSSLRCKPYPVTYILQLRSHKDQESMLTNQRQE